jgi:NitT/TauT family transport system substrate-binding protein
MHISSRRAGSGLAILSGTIVVALWLLSGAPVEGAERKIILQGASPAPNLGYASMYVAQEVGFFKQEGLTVGFEYSQGGFLAIQLTASGKADITSNTVEPLILGYSKGIRAKAFYRYNTRLLFYIGVPVNSPIKTVADLRGKRIGTFSMGSAIIPVVRSHLKLAGVPPEEVTILPVGIGDQAAAALTSGKVDVLAMWDPAFAALETSGLKFRYLWHPLLKNVGNGGYFASDSFINANPDAVRGFARAVAKGTVFAMANPEAAVRIFWKVSPAARGGGSETEALEKAIYQLNYILGGFSIEDSPVKKYGYIDMEGWRRYVDILQSEGFLTEKPPIEEIATNAFIDYANNFDAAAVKALAKTWKLK